jgi:hypothetical protein
MINEYEKQANDFLEKTKTTFKAEFLKYDFHFDGDKDKRNIFKITLSNKNGKYFFNFGSSLNDSCTEIKKAIIESEEETKIFYGFQLTRLKEITFTHTIETTYPKLLAISKGEIELTSIINSEQLKKDYDLYCDIIKVYNKKNKYITVNKTRFSEVENNIKKRILTFIDEAKKKMKVFKAKQKESFSAPSSYDVLTCLTKYDPGTFENFCSEYGYDEDSRTAEKTYKAFVKEYKSISALYSESELELMAEIQ